MQLNGQWKPKPQASVLLTSHTKCFFRGINYAFQLPTFWLISTQMLPVISHSTACKKEFDETATINYITEEPWLLAPHDEITMPSTDPAEDPWLCQPIPQNGPTLIPEEDTVTTFILINSSICTMQRIAVLENHNLVELLLEPVKNNVLCDSVYVGVVTKLAPHMGGAFVNIGCSRPSFMDIKPKREPFVVPSFDHQVEDARERSSVFGNLGQVLGVSDNEMAPDGVDDIDEDDLEDVDDDTEINSIEYVGNDFLENVHPSHGDISDYRSENLNGSVIVNGVKTGPNKHEKVNGYAHEQDNNLETGILNSELSSTDGNKWAHVQKGTKIIVQVMKEGLGTKGPTLTAYPKLKSRFWILIARSSTIGISKKISGVERTRLRVIAKTLQPPGFGLTVRTVASDHSLEELQKDLEGLLSTWKTITEHARSAALASDEGVDGAVPVMLHRAMGKTLSVVQDYFTDRVKSMVVDSPRTYHEVRHWHLPW
ncbi:endoribonuclease [Lithospermum erythrorhizon]|uniref:Endoribonuclease n=1 Tax=Lithospermum erythrorhizon TaxID=34254 RepID=A0AAV3QZY3_LITER